MDSSSTVSVAAVASAAAEKTVETCQLGDSETNSATVASATSTTAPKQQRGNKNRNNHKKNDTPNNESNTSSSSSKQGNKNNSNNNNYNKNSNPNNATRQQRNSGNNSKASPANHERHNLSANDTAVNDITNKSSPTSNSAYGNGKKQQQWGGPKKQNLNHLLNFTYESQRDNENYYEYERQGRQFWSTKLAKNSYFSKEQFLQANCQFLVKSGSGNDYSVHMSDPDRLVEWEKIEEVHIDSHSPISCPICLHEPTAGKMTKCGHVYCWSCLLHYLSLSDKPWRKCPICYESVYKCDLKSARVIKNSCEYKVGDEIEMQLVCKPRDLKYSTVCVAASDIHRVVGNNNSLLSYETFAKLPAECANYLKLHSYSPKRIHEMVIQREREELNKQLEAEKDQPEVCFVNEALVLLDEREAKLIEEIGRGSEATKRRHHSSNRTAKVEASVEPVADNFAAVEKPSIRYVDAFDEEVATDVDNKSVADNNPKEVVEESKQDLAPTTTQPPKEEEKHEEIKTPKPSSSIGSSQLEMAFFYQSADGQRIFISGFNNRCLLSEYTSLSHAPDRIRARIIASDSLFMSEDNRRHRYKYLAHLPLHSEFKIVELDLESASSPSRILSDKTLEAFREEFDDRRRSRERKMAREKRECDRLAAQAAERELAYVPHYYVQSAMTDVNRTRDTIVSGGYLNEFPEASSSPPLSSGASLLSENSSNVSTTASSSSASATSATSDPALVAQMSFAQKLKNTSTTSNTTAWPSLDQFSSTTVSTSTTATLGGWVNMAKQQQAQMSMSGRAKRCQNAPVPWSDKTAAPASRTSISGDDGEPEREEKESMPAPSYKQSFFSAIDETLRLIDAKKETTEEDKLAADSATSTTATTTNKKKKKTKQLLFSTSLNRAF